MSGRTNAVEIIGLNKWFKAFHVLKDINLDRRAGRARGDLRAVGLGQVDA